MKNIHISLSLPLRHIIDKVFGNVLQNVGSASPKNAPKVSILRGAEKEPVS